MNLEGVLEGLLYVVGDDGITLDSIIKILDINEEESQKLVLTLKEKYEASDRGLRISYLGNSIKLTTKEEHKEYFSKLFDNTEIGMLSQSALETLAIIAYNEPITRLKVDALRGVDTTYQIRKLVAKGFIKECGKADLPGRPILYKTTNEFLDYFGMSSIKDLPEIKEEENTIDEEGNLFLSNYKE